MVTGIYLMFVAAAGYYVRFFGGSWGRALQVAFVFAGLLALGTMALLDVNLAVEGNGITGLIGPNGAGKTSLLNMISGFYKPDEGRITLEGRDIDRKSTRLNSSHT